MKYVIHTDGGSRGNPGPAAVGVVIEREKKLVASFGMRIGETTNNVAEYSAVIEGLKYFLHNKKKDMHLYFFLDSTLVVNQMNGLFKVKDQKMRELLLQVRLLEQELGCPIYYAAIRREENFPADYQVNKALDAA